MSNDGLIAALAKAQAEMENAPLNKVNPHFKSKYADLAAIRDAVVPVLAKYGIAVVQPVEVGDDGRAYVVTRLLKDADVLESRCPIMAGPQCKPQEFGSAMTYARRYGLASMVGISAEEDDDANAAQDAKPAKAASKAPPAKVQTAKEKPVFERLQDAARARQTPDELDKLWEHEAFQKEFYALPTDQQEAIRQAFAARRNEILATAA